MENDYLRQKAVLWENNGYDRYGKIKLKSPVEIDCRWEKGHEESLDHQGHTVGYDVNVVVDQDIAPGSILWLGSLADVPSPPTNLRQVIEFRKTPDIKAVVHRRVVRLARYSDELPSIG